MDRTRLLLMLASLVVVCAGCRPDPLPDDLPPSWTGLSHVPGSPATAVLDSQTTVRLDEAGLPLPGPGKVMRLNTILRRALKANRQLANRHDQLQVARLRVQTAEADFQLQILPQGTAGLSEVGNEGTGRDYGAGFDLEQKFITGTVVTVGPSYTRTGDIHTSRARVRITQPLLQGIDWDFNQRDILAGEFSVRTARRALFLARVDTLVNTVTAAYEVVRQRALMQLNQESVARLRGHVEAAKIKAKMGISDEIDVHRAQLQLKSAEDLLLAAQQAHEDAKDELKFLINWPLDEPLRIEAPLSFDLVRLRRELAIKLAISRRVELRQARDTIEDFQRRARVNRHAVLPRVDLVFEYSRFGTDEEGSFSKSTNLDEDSWNVAIVGGSEALRRREYLAFEQSQYSVRQAERAKGILEDRITFEVKRELRELGRSEKSLHLSQDQIQKARKQLALAKVKFQHGLASNLDVILAEIALRDAQTRLVSVAIDAIVGNYRLRAALGTLLEPPEQF